MILREHDLALDSFTLRHQQPFILQLQQRCPDGIVIEPELLCQGVHPRQGSAQAAPQNPSAKMSGHLIDGGEKVERFHESSPPA